MRPRRLALFAGRPDELGGVQAIGAPAFSAASAGGRTGSQCTARKRLPVTAPAASDTSQTSGGAITAGWIICARSNPAACGTIAVLVTPPGTTTLTVTPLPS